MHAREKAAAKTKVPVLPRPHCFFTWAGRHGVAGSAGCNATVACAILGGKLNLECASAQAACRQLPAAKQSGHTLFVHHSGLREECIRYTPVS